MRAAAAGVRMTLRPMVRVAVTENGRTSFAWGRDEGQRYWCQFDNGACYSVDRSAVAIVSDETKPCGVPDTPYSSRGEVTWGTVFALLIVGIVLYVIGGLWISTHRSLSEWTPAHYGRQP